MNLLSEVGTAYNITGGVLIARALLFTANRFLRQQAGTFWDGNKALFQALVLQRLDAQFGLPAVLVGSGMQLISGLDIDISARIAALFGVIWFVFLLAYAVFRRRTKHQSDGLFDKTPLQ